MPFLRLLMPFIAGIVASAYSPVWLWLSGILGFICSLLPTVFPIGKRFALRWLYGIGIHLLLAFTGMLIGLLRDHRLLKTWYGHEQPPFLLVRTSGETAGLKGKPGFSTDAEIIAIRHSIAFLPRGSPRQEKAPWQMSTGRIRLTILSGETLPRGSIILIRGELKPLSGISAHHFSRRNIYHRIYVDTRHATVLLPARSASSWIQALRKRILELLDQQFQEGSQRSLAKALLVGYRRELDDTLNTAYANTGVIHVIAISGMHLGLIYGLLTVLLKPLSRKRLGRIFTNLFIMALLWVFTLLCGAAPSVTRSALMFSSLLLADSAGEDNSAPNALASSAFILLCIDPMMLYDVGFQLSYAAVASLMIFNTPVRRLYQPENLLLVQAWSLVATSCAAQILTTPLVLQYFGRAPLLFLPANLVAIPLSGLILVLLIMICLFYPFESITQMLASVSGWLMDLMNERIIDLSKIPFASLTVQWGTRDTIFTGLLIALSCFLPRAFAKRT